MWKAPNMGGPPSPEALYQQNNLIQQIVHLEWDQNLREIVQGNNSSIEQIIAEVQRINQAMGQISSGVNNAFGQVRTDAQNHQEGMASLYQHLADVNLKLGILENEETRLQQSEIGGLKERCKKIEHEGVRMERKWPGGNRTQLDQVQSERSQLHSNPRDSNPFGSNSMSSNPMGLDQVSFNRDGFNAMSSNPNQDQYHGLQSNAVQWIKCCSA